VLINSLSLFLGRLSSFRRWLPWQWRWRLPWRWCWRLPWIRIPRRCPSPTGWRISRKRPSPTGISRHCSAPTGISRISSSSGRLRRCPPGWIRSSCLRPASSGPQRGFLVQGCGSGQLWPDHGRRAEACPRQWQLVQLQRGGLQTHDR